MSHHHTIVSLGSTGEYHVFHTEDGEFIETREGPERSVFYTDGIEGIRRNLEPRWSGESLPWTDALPWDGLTDGSSVSVDPSSTGKLHDGSFDAEDQRYVYRWDWMTVVIDIESDGVGAIDVGFSEDTELFKEQIVNDDPTFERDRMGWEAGVTLYKWDDTESEWQPQHVMDDRPDEDSVQLHHPNPGSWDEGDTLLLLIGGPWDYSLAEPDLPVESDDVSIRGGRVIERTELPERQEGEGDKGNARFKILDMDVEDLAGDSVPAITDVGARLGDIEIPGPD